MDDPVLVIQSAREYDWEAERGRINFMLYIQRLNAKYYAQVAEPFLVFPALQMTVRENVVNEVC